MTPLHWDDSAREAPAKVTCKRGLPFKGHSRLAMAFRYGTPTWRSRR